MKRKQKKLRKKKIKKHMKIKKLMDEANRLAKKMLGE